MNHVEDPRTASKAGLPKIVRRDLTSARKVVSREKPSFSIVLRVVVGIVCVGIIGYAWAVTSEGAFPESVFHPSFLYRDTPRDEFCVVRPSRFNREMVRVGGSWAKTEGRLLVVSLVRNCAKSVPCMEKKISVLASVFKSVHVVVFENDSNDGTRTKLLKYAKGEAKLGDDNVRVTVVNPFTMMENEEVCLSNDDAFRNSVKTGIKGASSNRIIKMAFLRNKVLDYVYQHQSEYDTLLTTDLDIIGRIFPEGIKETVGYLRTKKDIGFVSFRGYFNGKKFFDPYAYKGTDLLSQTSLTSLLACLVCQYNMPSGVGLKPVVSAHSGGAFANLPLPPHLRYLGKHVLTVPFVTDVYLCEHVTFLEQVKNNFINTNMTFLVKENV